MTDVANSRIEGKEFVYLNKTKLHVTNNDHFKCNRIIVILFSRFCEMAIMITRCIIMIIQLLLLLLLLLLLCIPIMYYGK